MQRGTPFRKVQTFGKVASIFGIYLQRSKDGVVEGNFVQGHAKSETNSGNAIPLWNCDGVLIFNNFVSGHRDGICFEVFYPKTRQEWRNWLEANHDKKSEIWLQTFTKASGKPSLSYNDSPGQAIWLAANDWKRERKNF